MTEIPTPPRNGYERRGGRNEITVLWANGKRYELPPLDLQNRDFDIAEAYYASQQKEDVVAVNDAMESLAKSPALKDEIITRLFHSLKEKNTVKGVPRQVVFSWLDSAEGAAFSIHLQLSKKYPEEFPPPAPPAPVDLSRAKDIIRLVTLGEILKARDDATPVAAVVSDAGRKAGLLENK